MFTATTFYRFEISERDSYRWAGEQQFATWAETAAHIAAMRDWANVRNVGQGAMMDSVVVRVSNGVSGERWNYTTFTAEGSGYFDAGVNSWSV